MERAFRDGYVTETGTGIAKILPPSNPFLPESGEKKQTVIEKLKAFLSKFLNTSERDEIVFYNTSELEGTYLQAAEGLE